MIQVHFFIVSLEVWFVMDDHFQYTPVQGLVGITCMRCTCAGAFIPRIYCPTSSWSLIFCLLNHTSLLILLFHTCIMILTQFAILFLCKMYNFLTHPNSILAYFVGILRKLIPRVWDSIFLYTVY